MNNVLLIPGFYSAEECKDELAYAAKSGFLMQKYGQHDRKRAFVDDPVRAAQIYKKLQIPELRTFYDNLKPDPPVCDCRDTGELSCSKCSGEGCSPYGVAANGPCTAGDVCPSCKGVLLSGWKPIGLNERLRYYQYEIGQVFTRHFDILYRINDNTRTFLTFICYLNEDFEGGQTIFDEEIIVPKTGDAILFPHELKHEGAMVTKGCKIILRSDVIFQR